ncbi:MAG: hypothetical protein PX640_22240 [Microcystis sp. M49629_WE12]|nr:hypothetical protein [Microcystis sp. M53602_WE12]MCE2663388.1 hypothetical protein [Microcystis sp. 53602_E8]MDJ0527918.1 hypothetical protein [Microcystis sp. M53600_WE12]MDJ0566607.1 hypothetical protein [Microcystis sp. M49629_WE12]MDJ0606835.1 hypothetical protein [Microcystis sp. M53602_WE12]
MNYQWGGGEVGIMNYELSVGKWGGEGFSGNLPITLNLYCLLHSASDIHQ